MTATPQLEEGFTRLANELLEAILGFGFSHREVLVLFTIIRKTYGYGKKSDDISASQIGDMCGIARPHVTATLNSLAARNVILKKQGRFGSIVGIQKNHTKWIDQSIVRGSLASTDSVQGCTDLALGDEAEIDVLDSTDSVHPSTKSVHVPNQYAASTDSVQVDSTESVHTKENLPKENLQKKARAKIRFATWLQNCKQEGVDPILSDNPVFDYAEKMGISVEYVRLCWLEFKRKYADSTKSYVLWPKHFDNAVRENWYGIWFEKDGGWQLTTRGKQIEKEHTEKSRKAVDAPN
jgi:phage replication O-like protein O